MSNFDFSSFDSPPAAALDFADQLRDWLETVKDAGTAIDSGGGFGARDLWVTVGGHEHFISIKRRERPN